MNDSGQGKRDGWKPELSQAIIDASMAAIEALDLAAVKRKVVAEKGWNQATADYAELRYRRFLCMHRLDRGRALVPLPDVDAFWHQHILFTREYAQDCDALFGEFFHHSPASGDKDEAQRRRPVLAETAEFYADIFGEDYFAVEPEHAPAGWVDLFI